MTQEELIAWHKLCSLDFSATKLSALLEAFGSPTAVLEAESEELRSVPNLREADIAAIERLRTEPAKLPSALEDGTIYLVCREDEAYPAPLRESVEDAPTALWVWGEILERDRFAVSVVGTRRPTSYGRMVTERFVRDLCEAGLTIVSGGAEGIDTIAHQTALEHGGRTIAILGSGLGKLYPSSNRRLFQQIAESGGAVISEYGYEAAPEAWRFPNRNRLIAGWGLATLVIEAPEASGAMITARLAAEMGREVFAVPGSIDNPASKGCHALIKDGAGLVECAQDILDALRIHSEPKERTLQLPMLTETQERLLSVLNLQPQHLDQLARLAELPIHQAQVELTTLEMLGLARRMPGGTFVRVL
ncbi:MAG: DNA-processing protein DprA [Fimbriimonadales bacterium]